MKSERPMEFFDPEPGFGRALSWISVALALALPLRSLCFMVAS